MKILIAEDEADLLSQYKEILEQNDHEVITTSDGEECLLSYRKAYEKWFKEKNDDSAPDTPFAGHYPAWYIPQQQLFPCHHHDSGGYKFIPVQKDASQGIRLPIQPGQGE